MAFKLNTTPDWFSAPGTRLEGGYELRESVSADGSAALFQAQLPDDSRPRALARLFHVNATAATRQRDLWQALTRVPHQNLLGILSSGETEISGELVAYVVTEPTDESLATVLGERSLSAEEVGGLLLSLIPALSRLHAAGFVHGRVCPAEIFAIGDTIKLSADCATRIGEKVIAYRGVPPYLAPEQQDENTTPAADVWCFGATLFEALTQRPFAAIRREEVPELPAPFGGIIARCVDPNPGARPPLAEILSLYHGKDIPQTVTHPPQPAVEVVNAPVNADRIVRLDTRRRTPLVPVLTTVFGLLILFSLWWIKNNTARRRQVPSPDGKTLTRQTAPAAPPVVPQAAAPVAPQAAAPVMSQAAPEQSPSRDVTQEVEPRTTNGPIWRVVLWTYSKRSDAQNKVDYLATRYPALQPEVFTPDANGGMYLVVVGGEMTRKQAEDTEFKARQLGLPRDTYIQNFSH